MLFVVNDSKEVKLFNGMDPQDNRAKVLRLLNVSRGGSRRKNKYALEASATNFVNADGFGSVVRLLVRGSIT